MSGEIRFRVRGPEGLSQIRIDKATSWRELLRLISEKSGVKGDFDLKFGYPPQALDVDSIAGAARISDLPNNLNGEQLIVVPRPTKSQTTTLHSNKPQASETISSSRSADATRSLQSKSQEYPQRPLGLTRKSKGDVESDPPQVPVPALDGTMILRVMPDDNSCMFRALSSAVLGPALDGMTELRSVVAQQIQAQPEIFTEGMLEKKPADYCSWIQREESWGGGIELSILSQHFGLEICSINVQDLRIDKFNEGQPTRCILVYSGIHYDVCAVSPFVSAEPDFDRKIFDVVRSEGEEFDGGALEAARELCKELQSRHYFTDTHGFAVRCNTCGENGTGEQWAVQHARQTGHGDFGEG